jgi:hypothetical protein
MLHQVLANPNDPENDWRSIPVLKLFRCGDGCCAEWELENEMFVVGEKIQLTEYQISDHEYQVIDDEFGTYRPAFYDISQYITDGYLQLVTP